jgi:hypothetical protein
MENGTSPELLQVGNDRTFNALWALGIEEGSFACECGRTDCSQQLVLALVDYDARDDQPLLARGHARAGPASSSLVNP